jgi:GT2 family glycosyltransferase
MSGFAWPRLLATCPNGGGVFVLDAHGATRLSHVDSTGLLVAGDEVRVATQADGARSWRHWHGPAWQATTLAAEPLDLHDLAWHEDGVLAACSERNAAVLYAPDGREQSRWQWDGDADACHLNSLACVEGRWLASLFGRFDTHRGYKGHTRGAGLVVDLHTRQTVLQGLSQPHSLLADGDALWLCDSETGRVLRWRAGHVDTVWSLAGYPRGLCRVGEVMLVGLSRPRNAVEDGRDGACVQAVAIVSGEVLAEIALPAPEIYDLRPCPVSLDLPAIIAAEAELHRQQLEARLAQAESRVLERSAWATAQDAELTRVREAFAGYREEQEQTLAQERAAFADYREEQEQTLAQERAAFADYREEQEQTLAQERAAFADYREEQEQTLAQTRAVLTELQAAFDERTRWALSLVEEVTALRPWVAHANALDATLEQILASKSWRATRPLRRLASRLRGEELEIRIPPRPDQASPSPSTDPLLGLAFAQHDAPQLSIVIPTYGKLDYTAACLRAIAASGDQARFEVIVLEDASGDPQIQRLAEVPGLRYHANPENLGFLRSCNQALALARGEYLCLLNNDTTPQPGWLDALLATFTEHPGTGLVGARLVYPDGRLQECGGIVWSDASGWNHGRLGDPEDPAFRYVHEADYVSGAALMLPMALWRQLGGFDERYAPAYYEDTDLAFRVREVGLAVRVQPRATVVHHEGVSHGTDTGSGIKAHQAVNQAVFRERWRGVLEHGHAANAEHPWLARDRAILRKSVLVVDHYVPQPDRDAGSRAIWQLLQRLVAMGLNVKFWPHNGHRDPVYTPWLEALGIEVLHGPHRAGFAAWYREHAQYFEQVILSRPEVAADCITSVRRHGAARVVYYGHDIHHRRMQAQAVVQQDPALAKAARQLVHREQALWRQADAVLYPSDEETAVVRAWLADARLPVERARTVPLFALPTPLPATSDGRADLLFVAGFAHPPNEDAACWLVQQVWPRLRERHPGLRLRLVGSSPTDAVRALAGADIEVTGWVSDTDLAAHYACARVVVVPLRFGAGMKGKVIEAMHHGVPVVTTPTGAQGLLAEAALLPVCDAAQAFAEAVSVLLDDDARWQAQSAAGQTCVARQFSEVALDAVLRAVLDVTPYADMAARRAALAGQR